MTEQPRKRGRPRIHPEQPNKPKRGRGRPKKTETERLADMSLKLYDNVRGDDDPAMALLPESFTAETRLHSLRDRSKLNKFFRAKRLGLPDDKACAIAGMSRFTLSGWKKEAIDEIDRRDRGEKANRDKDDHIIFYVAYAHATYAPLTDALDVIQDSIKDQKDVNTARWLVERLAPEAYAPTRRVEVSGQSGVNHQHTHILQLSPQQMDMLGSGSDGEVVDAEPFELPTGDDEDESGDYTEGGE